MAVTCSVANILEPEAAADVTAIGSAATLTIYSGTRPASPDAAVSGATALATFTWSGAAATSANGVVTMNSVASVAAAASGTAAWARLASSSQTPATAGLFDFSVTATGGGGDITLPTTTITADVTVSLTSLTITEQ